MTRKASFTAPWLIVGSIFMVFSFGSPLLLQAKFTPTNAISNEEAIRLGEEFGIIVGEVDEEIQEFLGLERPEGVVVFEVIGESLRI